MSTNDQTRIIVSARRGHFQLDFDMLQRLTDNFNAQHPEANFILRDILCAFNGDNYTEKVVEYLLQRDGHGYADPTVYFRSHPALLKIIDESGLPKVDEEESYPLRIITVPTKLIKYCEISQNDDNEEVARYNFENLLERTVPNDPESLSREEAVAILRQYRALLNARPV